MTIYNCKECNFITENNYNYQKHVNTKKHQKNTGKIEDVKSISNIPQIYHKYTSNIPQGILNIPQDNNIIYECDYCDAGFKHKSGKYRHQKNYCKAKKTSDDKDKKIEHLEKLLNDAMKQINTTNNNTTTTTNNNNCTTNNIININGYGKEDITYLTNEEWLKLLKNPRDSIVNLFLETHFNPEHPENTNIRQRNRNSKFIEVHDGDNWKNKKKKKMLSDVAEDKQGILDDKVAKNDEIYNSMSERQRRNHETFHDEVFYNDRKEIVEEMEAAILDSI